MRLGQDRDRVGLEAGARGLAGFELATEDEGWERELVLWQAEAGAKEDFPRPAAGQRHEGHAFFQVAVAARSASSWGAEPDGWGRLRGWRRGTWRGRA